MGWFSKNIYLRIFCFFIALQACKSVPKKKKKEEEFDVLFWEEKMTFRRMGR